MTLPSLDLLLQQEAESHFTHFSFARALQIGQTLYQRAVSQQLPVAVEVYAFGQPVFFAALPDSAPDNLAWMKRKRNTVLRMAHSSLYMGFKYEAEGLRMDKMPWIEQPEYCDHGGSFPLFLTGGALIGAVTVSGLPSADDHALALWAIRESLTSTLDTHLAP
ncbi:heme-degrading domain-containing protein [Citrobacter sp. JGM124]|uniref:heme-degrading domain-containing protein n=1 Tax=Citrobacter sp. JGM124 TaxID=2799789 RepID=UPI001BADB22B|nr:heme-degrading domain-containing protein [Citrobacter sp. JGM124]MBS0847825.1 heme-degrading domain-containing protein [Citrobacter sp. JGM124]